MMRGDEPLNLTIAQAEDAGHMGASAEIVAVDVEMH
jgi:hypothetical protein